MKSNLSFLALIAILLAVLAATPPAYAQAPASPGFEQPIDCELGVTCFIQNYVDHDPGPDAKDYTCGPRTYDKHTGTDIRIRDLREMKQGVAVLAAADGVVWRTRDEMDDINVNDIGRDAVKGRDAGNAVIINHPGGWQTIYAHMRRGSVRVKPGDKVEKGDVLGLVGLSGLTEFPHVHFEVRYQNQVVDPFSGTDLPIACETGATKPPPQNLWDKSLTSTFSLFYRRGELINAGFADRQVGLEDVMSGDFSAEAQSNNADIVDGPNIVIATIPRDSSALIFWVLLSGLEKGDTITLMVQDQNKQTFAETHQTLDRAKAQWVGFVGKANKGAGFMPGVYSGYVRVERTDASGNKKIVIDSGTQALVQK